MLSKEAQAQLDQNTAVKNLVKSFLGKGSKPHSRYKENISFQKCKRKGQQKVTQSVNSIVADLETKVKSLR